MKRFVILFLLIPVIICSQNKTTVKIETLNPPSSLLELTNVEDIYKKLILKDINLSENDFKKDALDFKYNIIIHKQTADKLVEFGFHPFFMGMYQAYADHRPFVLSPDMMWLLISQGFAAHINNNPEEMRKYMVDHDGKMSLFVRSDELDLNNPNAPWEEVFDGFTEKIKENTKDDLVNVMVADFSTTTPITKVASQVTLMNTTKSYFEFIVIRFICGIPEITIEGTADDWKKVLQRTKALRKYELDWWIDEIEPVLKEIVDAVSLKKINRSFWMNIFKKHTEKMYGNPTKFDGWIVKFFPYNKYGKKNNLKEISKSDILPNEMLTVDMLYKEIDAEGTLKKEIPLELWAGFIGLIQDEETFALKPEIGWMVKKKNIYYNKALADKFQKKVDGKGGAKLSIRINKVPEELLVLKKISRLELNFTDNVNIPLRMSNIEIEELTITGNIIPEQIESICRMFPNTYLIINRKGYNKAEVDNKFF